MRTVQADSCLNSEQIDTLFSRRVRKGALGGGWSFCAGDPKLGHACLQFLFDASCFLISFFLFQRPLICIYLKVFILPSLLWLPKL